MARRVLWTATFLMLAGCGIFDTTADQAPVYIVFFHYDSTFLTPDARGIVDQAAASARNTNPSTIELAGYTDASAAPSSRRFAEPRFNAVAEALILDGINPKILTRVPLKDSEASLPSTADRRIEIRLINKATP